jgi:hypothetical protein
MIENFSTYEVPCNLDCETLERAVHELNEKDTNQVAVDIGYIRNWLLKQTHIKSRTDDQFILMFLRFSKFSYLKCQQLIEHYWTNRTKMSDVFNVRKDLLNECSVFMEIAYLGDFIWLPKIDKFGRRLNILRASKWNLDKYDWNDYFRYKLCCNDLICEDPRVQINGVVFLADLGGLNSSHASVATPDNCKKMVEALQVSNIFKLINLKH